MLNTSPRRAATHKLTLDGNIECARLACVAGEAPACYARSSCGLSPHFAHPNRLPPATQASARWALRSPNHYLKFKKRWMFFSYTAQRVNFKNTKNTDDTNRHKQKPTGERWTKDLTPSPPYSPIVKMYYVIPNSMVSWCCIMGGTNRASSTYTILPKFGTLLLRCDLQYFYRQVYNAIVLSVVYKCLANLD